MIMIFLYITVHFVVCFLDLKEHSDPETMTCDGQTKKVDKELKMVLLRYHTSEFWKFLLYQQAVGPFLETLFLRT